MNTEYIYKRAASKIWLLRRLRIFIDETEILTDFYVKEIRSILEYAIPVWYSSITLEQSKYLEKIQQYSVSIILNNWSLSYKVKCTLLSIEPLYLRRRQIALNFSKRTAANPRHKDLFKIKTSAHNTRGNGIYYEEVSSRSDRHFKSPLVSLTRDMNKDIRNKTRGH